jgi:hypothetical protein
MVVQLIPTWVTEAALPFTKVFSIHS